MQILDAWKFHLVNPDYGWDATIKELRFACYVFGHKSNLGHGKGCQGNRPVLSGLTRWERLRSQSAFCCGDLNATRTIEPLGRKSSFASSEVSPRRLFCVLVYFSESLSARYSLERSALRSCLVITGESYH